MEMNSTQKNRFILTTRGPRTRSLVVNIFIILIFGGHCALTTQTTATAQLFNVEEKIGATNNALEKETTGIAQLFNVEEKIGATNNALEKEVRNIANEVKTLTKNISGLNEQILNMGNRIQEVFLDSFHHTSTGTIFKYLWKFDDYSSRIGNMNERHDYYSPAFYSSPHGYKMKLICHYNTNFIDIGLTTLRGENDNLLPWPVSGSITISVLDQSPQPKDYVAPIHQIAPEGECEKVWHQNNTDEKTYCFITRYFASPEQLSARNLVKDDIMYISMKFEMKNYTLNIYTLI